MQTLGCGCQPCASWLAAPMGVAQLEGGGLVLGGQLRLARERVAVVLERGGLLWGGQLKPECER